MLNLCITSGVYEYLVPGFRYLWDKYTNGLPIEIVKTGDKEQWCADVARRVRMSCEDQILIVLEDYWLTQPLNTEQFTILESVVKYGADKADLMEQVAYFAHEDYGRFGLLKACPVSGYKLSLQAAIWNKKFLLRKLATATNPWNFELQDTDYDGSLIVGFPKRSFEYANIMLKGSPMYYEVAKIREFDEMDSLGLIPDNIKAVRS